MNIIGISGKMGVGKSTLAAHLLSKLNGLWVRKSFADALREEVSIEFNIPVSQIYHDKTIICTIPIQYQPDLGCEQPIRKILQYWGQKRRSEDPFYWTDRMDEFIYSPNNYVYGVVIDDVRFPEEVECIKDNGGMVIKIHPYSGYENTDNDISETALDDYTGFFAELKPEYGELRKAADTVYKKLVADKVI